MQIEYALARVAQGKMALGIKATNGVVIAADKKVSSVLVDAEDYQKIQSITPSTGKIEIIAFHSQRKSSLILYDNFRICVCWNGS